MTKSKASKNEVAGHVLEMEASLDIPPVYATNRPPYLCLRVRIANGGEVDHVVLYLRPNFATYLHTLLNKTPGLWVEDRNATSIACNL